MRSKASRSVTAMVAGLLMCACSDSANQVAPVSFDTIVTVVPTALPTTVLAPTTDVTTTVATTTVPATTVAPATTAASLGGPVFSDALGVKVPTAPGINTPGDTRQLLPEGLYVHIAWTADPNDASVFTVFPGDEPILEAYANGAATFYAAAVSTRTTDSDAFSRYFVDDGAKFDQAFEQARAGSFVKDLGQGVVLRPYVLGDNRTETSAIVLDCSLSFEQWVSPQTPYVAMSSPVTLGNLVTMVEVDGQWITDTVSAEPTACL